MQAIYSCKLYRSSKRKSKIKSAIENPVNSELVSQLSRYLDDEYVLVDEDINNKKNVQKSESDENTAKSEGSRNHTPLHSIPKSSSIGDIDDFDLEEEQEDSIPAEEDEIGEEIDEDQEDQEDETASVEESTSILEGKSTVTASIVLSQDTVAEIKGVLNLREDTKGVDRISFKDNELWIYYNDNINLNNVMSNVIELLNESGYTYLEFNRLARSANSIVFQVCIEDTNNCVKSLEVDDDDKKSKS